MGFERTEEVKGAVSSCPRARVRHPSAAADFCPALDNVIADPGTAEHLSEAVEALLECRAFLWDVLLDGDWTGCANEKLAELAALYGWEKVCEMFEEK